MDLTRGEIMFHQGTFDMMIQRGGVFVQKLAEAWRVADNDNSERLIRAFPECFATFRAFADQDKMIRKITEVTL